MQVGSSRNKLTILVPVDNWLWIAQCLTRQCHVLAEFGVDNDMVAVVDAGELRRNSDDEVHEFLETVV